MKQITVLVADDHAVFREGLCMLLSQEPDMKVVGEAVDGHQAIAMAEALRPDIMLLDVRMPRLDGLKALPRIRLKSPETKILILSGFLEDDFIVEALQNGAKGYLVKTLSTGDLLKAIRATHAGEVWAERKVLAHLLDDLLQKVNPPKLPASEARMDLTNREQEIVKWATQGLTNKEIAARLGISDKTVKTHLGNIFSKLKISRRLQLLLHRISGGPH